jgi:hypothetical protein
MANLNLDIDYFDHPKTKRLIRLLGKGSEVLPLKLWVYTARYHKRSGELTGISAQEIEDECKWWGEAGKMVEVMLATGKDVKPELRDEFCFLKLVDGTYVVPNWVRRQGHLQAFEERARNGARKRWDRAGGNATDDACSNATSNATSNAPALPALPAYQQPADAGDFPEILRTEKFAEAWAEWEKYKREKRQKITPTARQLQLSKLASYGHDAAITSLRESISNGWTGVFPPKTSANANGKRVAPISPVGSYAVET